MTIDYTLMETSETRAEQRGLEERMQAQRILSQTDWAVVRQAETGEPVPAQIRAEREAARRILKVHQDK